jgi:hypothetical protein
VLAWALNRWGGVLGAVEEWPEIEPANGEQP